MPSTRIEPQPIRPTLYIGLGGTGKEVLLRLRRRFYERFRTAGLPCTGYLWVDTDTRDVGARGEPIDEALGAVSLDRAEQFPLMQGNVGRELLDIFQNKERYEHIHEWLYPEVERYGMEIADGAGGVRAVGRLTFFHKFPALREHVRNALDKLCTLERIRATENFFREHNLGQAMLADPPNPVVVVVCSLAGGTGCGTIVDIAFMLREMSRPPLAIEQQFAYVFLPNVYYTNAETQLGLRSYGNSYAALKELDFYTLRPVRRQTGDKDELGIDYNVRWTARERLKIPGPPFSALYLLEMRNEGGLKLEDQNRKDLFGVLAESLFLDVLPGAFSNAKRSNYSNIVGDLSSVQNVEIPIKGISFPQRFARRYSTCGLSKMEVPLDSIRGACAAKLAQQLLEHVLRERHDVPFKTEILDDLESYRFSGEGIKDRFGTFWKDEVRKGIAETCAKRPVQTAADAQQLDQDFKGMEEALVRADGSDKMRWGTVIGAVRSKTGKVTDESKTSVNEWIRDRCLENEARGLVLLVQKEGFFDCLLRSLVTLYTPPEEGVKAKYDMQLAALEDDITAWGQRKHSLLQELTAAASSFTVSALGVKSWAIAKIAERLRDAEEQYLLARAEKCVVEESRSVARALVQYINSQRPAFESFKTSADILRSRFSEKGAAFLSLRDHVFFIRLFDQENDWPRFYKLGIDEQKQPRDVNPMEEYTQFVKSTLGGNGSLYDLILRNDGEKEIESRFAVYTESRFWTDFETHKRLVNVLDHPDLKDRQRRAELVQLLVRSARPLLRQTEIPGAGGGVARRAYLGICRTDQEPYRSFIDEVKKVMEGIGVRYPLEEIATDRPEEIYLFFTNYAFALPGVPVVTDECHKAYARFYEQLGDSQHGDSSAIPLHLSTKWEGRFDDLVLYTSDEARKVHEIRSILLFGTMLKVLTIRETAGQAQYQYKVGPPRNTMVALGARRTAIAVLQQGSQGEDTRSMLSAAIQERERSLDTARRTAYFWCVQAAMYSPEMTPLLPEYSLLSNKLEELYNELLAQSVDKAILDLDKIAEDQRFDHIRSNADLGLDWVARVLPTIKALEVWAKPSATATTPK